MSARQAWEAACAGAHFLPPSAVSLPPPGGGSSVPVSAGSTPASRLAPRNLGFSTSRRPSTDGLPVPPPQLGSAARPRQPKPTQPRQSTQLQPQDSARGHFAGEWHANGRGSAAADANAARGEQECLLLPRELPTLQRPDARMPREPEADTTAVSNDEACGANSDLRMKSTVQRKCKCGS